MKLGMYHGILWIVECKFTVEISKFNIIVDLNSVRFKKLTDFYETQNFSNFDDYIELLTRNSYSAIKKSLVLNFKEFC